MKPVIFVSRPSVLSSTQESMFSLWGLCLTELGFSAERLPRQQHSGKPWEQLPRLLASTDGVVVLGFRQVTVEPCFSRPGVRSGSAWTSPWVQIEAAMAIMNRIPVLMAPEPGVTEGVFEPSTWRGCAISALTEAVPSRTNIPAEWTNAVMQRFRERTR
jgi:hypothetical protein